MLKRFFFNEANLMLLIGLNALVISWMYFPGWESHRWLERADRLITLVFVIEAIVKLRVEGVQQYFQRSWNRFDFALVLVSVPSLMVGVLPIRDASFWLLLRLLRLARLVRLFQFVPHIDRLLAGLGRALKASFLVLAILAFFNFLLAMVTCHFFREISPELFGDPIQSMYTIFQVFTVEGWNAIPEQIGEDIEARGVSAGYISSDFLIMMTRIYFATAMLLGGIFGLSLANAVFVDEMTIDNTDDLERKVDVMSQQIEELHRLLVAQQASQQDASRA